MRTVKWKFVKRTGNFWNDRPEKGKSPYAKYPYWWVRK
jgi:hypothetical protein